MKCKVKIGSLEQYLGKFEDAEAILERKGWDTAVSINEDEEKVFVATINSNVVDADGDIVMPDGCNIERYINNPILLWGHNHSNPPIGKCTDIKIDNTGITAKYKMANTTVANEIWSLIKGGFLKANSVGFIAIKSLLKGTKAFNDFVEKTKIDATNCKRIITNWMLLENSLVSIPSNQSALIQAIATKSIVLDEKLTKELGIETVAPVVEPKVEIVEPIVEAKIEPIIEKVEPIVEPVLPVRMWNVIRVCGYVTTPKELKEFKSLVKNGYCIK